MRPADANETAFAWKAILERQSVWNTGPVGLALSRQNVPVLAGTSAEGVAKGAYVLADAEGDLQVIILSSGSEVQIALAARDTLHAEGIGTRVVSVPSLDWFEAQDAEYIENVLPKAVTARVSVEAAIAQPWWRWIGSQGRPVSLEHYGASADAATSIASSASLRTQLLRPPRNHWPRRTLRTRSRTAPLLSRAQSKTSDVEPTRSRQGRS